MGVLYTRACLKGFFLGCKGCGTRDLARGRSGGASMFDGLRSLAGAL